MYFGREDLIRTALDKIEHFTTRGGEAPIFGSYWGVWQCKSSLARAGVIAAIIKGTIASSSNWPIVSFRPGHNH
jgi:hypothetical protein